LIVLKVSELSDGIFVLLHHMQTGAPFLPLW
jgi:hypothetical protein